MSGSSDADPPHEVDDAVGDETTTAAAATTIQSSFRYETALREVLTNPDKNWKKAPPKLKIFKPFLVDVIQKASNLPPKADFERQFPQQLRFDKDVVLAFCSRSDFETIYNDRHLFVPECLITNKQVMLAYCSKIRRSLQECAEDLTDDRDVVRAAIGLDGLELQYASRRLQEDEEMLKAACASNGRALDYFCPLGDVRAKLLGDKECMSLVLSNKDGVSMFRYMTLDLQRDPDLLLQAVQHGFKMRSCPLPYRKDKEFVLKAVSRRSSVYLELEKDAPLLQNDEDVAVKAASAADSTHDIQQAALKQVPGIGRDRRVALAIVDRGQKSFLSIFLINDQPVHLDDKEIMLHAVEKDPSLVSRCPDALRRDVDIALAAITEDSAASVLPNYNDAWLGLHPQVVVKAVEIGRREILWTVKSRIPLDVWRTHRPLWISWIRRGGKVLPEFEETVRGGDVELALLIAEFSWHEFQKVGDGLLGNADFMKRAIAVSGRVLRFAAPNIQSDIEFAVRATANNAYAMTSSSPFTKAALRRHVESQLGHSQVFMTEFLPGVSIKRPGCALPLLNQGAETGLALKKRIAVFLGIPFAETLKLYHKCLVHLKNPPPPSVDLMIPEIVGVAGANDVVGGNDDMFHDMMFRARQEARARMDAIEAQVQRRNRLMGFLDRDRRDRNGDANNGGQAPARMDAFPRPPLGQGAADAREREMRMGFMDRDPVERNGNAIGGGEALARMDALQGAVEAREREMRMGLMDRDLVERNGDANGGGEALVFRAGINAVRGLDDGLPDLLARRRRLERRQPRMQIGPLERGRLPEREDNVNAGGEARAGMRVLDRGRHLFDDFNENGGVAREDRA